MRIVATILLLLAVSQVGAGTVNIKNIRTWPAPDHTRIVLDVDGPLEHTLFMLRSPDRVVLDLRRARLSHRIPGIDGTRALLTRIRAAPRGESDLRIVFDLNAAVQPKSFLLKPNDKYGHRLVVDLHKRGEATAKSPVKRAFAGPGRRRDVVVAIDAGHGGEDPGAIAPKRVHEKNVVLQIARELARQLGRVRGIKPVLVRDGDYYVGLRRRMEIARKHRADLFLSIHADSFRDPRVSGSSVYILSRNGASSEAARWLAEQENSADLVGGVKLDDKDELLASVLLDLSQTATLTASSEVGSKVLTQLGGVGKRHKRQVERAGFMVLKSPDIPSILVETGFLTSPSDAKRLSDPKHQRQVAKAIVKGVVGYFERNAPPGTLFAARRHIIAKGETLSEIAARYRTTVSSLRAANELSGSRIRVGDVLRIPAYGDG